MWLSLLTLLCAMKFHCSSKVFLFASALYGYTTKCENESLNISNDFIALTYTRANNIASLLIYCVLQTLMLVRPKHQQNVWDDLIFQLEQNINLNLLSTVLNLDWGVIENKNGFDPPHRFFLLPVVNRIKGLHWSCLCLKCQIGWMKNALACFYTPTYLIQLYFPITHHRQPLQWSKTNCTQTDREAKALKLQMEGDN